ncbi:hypothetical protein ACGFI5_04975 [Micromonospora tulbaghiae]|uniref:Uncharacterized protein n=1 Tax=Micromonospora tulbaghiae TaxID=479978 RepID=A0ABY0KF43_9ACTN|nr:hypothetical protein [Micromonospora tulbaghiae]MDX5456695.1 hypothetical protein [Micromonospora tulbaghiae]SCE64887.1 hypothetical protein GA0070562_1264 [Micromonospora tulbaghiae]
MLTGHYAVRRAAEVALGVPSGGVAVAPGSDVVPVLGSDVGSDDVAEGSDVGSDEGSEVADGSAVVTDGSGLGLGSGVPGCDGDGDGEGTGDGRGGRTGVGRTGADGGGGAATGRDRCRAPRSLSSGRAGAAGSTGRAGGTEVTSTAVVGVDGAGAWVPRGIGMTTGPTEGVGRNGVLVSGRALLPTVADPVLIAARIGIEAVPASNATVSR